MSMQMQFVMQIPEPVQGYLVVVVSRLEQLNNYLSP